MCSYHPLLYTINEEETMRLAFLFSNEFWSCHCQIFILFFILFGTFFFFFTLWKAQTIYKVIFHISFGDRKKINIKRITE